MRTAVAFRLLVCVLLVAVLLCVSGCGFHFGRTKSPEGAVDESLKIDLLQSNFTLADDLSPPGLRRQLS